MNLEKLNIEEEVVTTREGFLSILLGDGSTKSTSTWVNGHDALIDD